VLKLLKTPVTGV